MHAACAPAVALRVAEPSSLFFSVPDVTPHRGKQSCDARNFPGLAAVSSSSGMACSHFRYSLASRDELPRNLASNVVKGSFGGDLSIGRCSTGRRVMLLGYLSVKASLTGDMADSESDDMCGGIGESGEISEARRRLETSLESTPRITGPQIRELLLTKYGRSYDVRLCKFNNRVYLQIMWKFLEQKSFHLTEEMYLEQLDAVAEFLNIWGVANRVREVVMTTRQRPGYTGGGGAKAVSIPLDIARGDKRGKEWMDHF